MKSTKSRRGAGQSHDLRGWITILVLVLTFGLAYAQIWSGQTGETIPPWAAGVLNLALQGYYMTKGAERHAEAMRRGRKK